MEMDTKRKEPDPLALAVRVDSMVAAVRFIAGHEDMPNGGSILLLSIADGLASISSDLDSSIQFQP